MANETLITDLVAREAIEQLEQLDKQMDGTLEKFKDCAKELAKGLKIPVEVSGDIDKLQQVYETTVSQVAKATKELQSQAQQQQKIIEETSQAIRQESSELSNNAKAQKEAADASRSALSTAEKVLGTTEEHYRRLAELSQQMKANKDARKELDRAEREGSVTTDQAIAKRAELLKKYDEMKVESQQLGRELAVEVKKAKEVEGSYNQLSQELEHLKQAYKKMSEEERNSAAGKELLNKIQTLDKELKNVSGTMGEFQRNVGNYQNSILGAIGVHGKLADSLLAGGTSFKAFGAAAKTEIAAFNTALSGLMANPVFLTIMGIVGIGAAFKFWSDYNDGLNEAIRLTKEFTGYSGEQLLDLRAQIAATADVMDKEYVDVLKSADALMANFHITGAEAMEAINKGFAAGADLNGDFLSKIEQMSGKFHDAGLSAKEMVAIMAQTRSGIFTDEGLAVIAKGSQQIRLMSKNTQESLKAIGIDAQQMQRELANGNMSVFEALQEVGGALKEIPDNSQEAAEAIRNVFGKVGLASAQEMIEGLQDMSTNLDEVMEKTGEYGELLLQQMDTEAELQKQVEELFGVTGGGWEAVKMKAGIYFNQVLIWITRWYNFQKNNVKKLLVVMYDYGNTFVAAAQTAGNMGSFVVKVAKNIGAAFVDLGGVIGNAITGEFEKASAAANRLKGRVNQVSVDFKNLVKQGKANFAAADSKTNSYRDYLFSDDGDYTPPPTGGGNRGGSGSGSGSGSGGRGSRGGRSGGGRSGGGRTSAENKKRVKELSELNADALKEEQKMLNAEIALLEKGYQDWADKSRDLAEVRRRISIEDEKKSYEDDLKQLKDSLNQKKITQEQYNDLEKRYASVHNANLIAIEEKYQDEKESIVKAVHDREEKERQEEKQKMLDTLTNTYATMQVNSDTYYQNAVAKEKEAYAAQLEVAKGNDAEMERIKLEHEQKLAEMADKYGIATIERQIESLEAQLDVENLTTDERAKLLTELSKLKADLENKAADAQIAAIERVTAKERQEYEKRQQMIQAWVQRSAEALNNIAALSSAIYDNKINQIEQELSAEQEKYNEQLAGIEFLAQQGSITQEEAEIRKRDAIAETARREEALNKKKAAYEYKKALIEKANSIAQIGISTALGIMQALAMWPPNIPLAAFVGTMGALQVATALAQPIKAYKEGTKDKPHPGGLAIVGDGDKPEVVMFGGRAWITPDSPTLVDLPKGAEVLPDASAIDPSALVRFGASRDNQPVIINDYDALEARMATNTKVLNKGLSQLRAEIKNQRFRNYIESKL